MCLLDAWDLYFCCSVGLADEYLGSVVGGARVGKKERETIASPGLVNFDTISDRDMVRFALGFIRSRHTKRPFEKQLSRCCQCNAIN